MRYRKLDSNGDYTFGQGSANFFVDNREAVAQAVLTSLLLFQGTWFLDTTVGIPWLTQVVGYNTQGLYDTAIKSLILGVTGVTGISSYSSSLNTSNRKLNVSVVIDTLFGQQPVSVIVNLLSGYGFGGFGEGGFGG